MQMNKFSMSHNLNVTRAGDVEQAVPYPSSEKEGIAQGAENMLMAEANWSLKIR
jgi:hypothetical protein